MAYRDLREFIRAHCDISAADIAHALEDELRVFSGDGSVQDDVTFVVVRVIEGVLRTDAGSGTR